MIEFVYGIWQIGQYCDKFQYVLYMHDFLYTGSIVGDQDN